MANSRSGAPLRPDAASWIGLLVGVGGVVGGLLLEGGKLSDITQVTAALIVFGGTLGAVLVTTPPGLVIAAAKSLHLVFFEPRYMPAAVIREMVTYGNRARRNGLVSLEKEVESIQEPFLKKALSLGVDGTDAQEIRSLMQLDLAIEEQRGKARAKVFEAAGGYAPTIGIIGAVLGLIQVMKHLQNIDEVGHGIAVAFVATVYGVGAANLFFLPAAGKIRARVEQGIEAKEMVLEGVCAIVEGLHPKLIERRLEAYVQHEASPQSVGNNQTVRSSAAESA